MPTACQIELLLRSLHDDLTAQESEAIAEHLSGCERCRVELERLAGSPEDWSSVQSVLSSTEFRAEQANGAFEDDSVIDFAVDFLAPASEPGLLGQLDGIQVLSYIGRGGMGLVLKGFQPELNRPVAVKLLAPHLASSGAARKRFSREAQAAAVIVHPNVMPILSVNSAAKLPYLVMPYLPCESLQERIDREGPLPLVDLLRIGVQVAKGLAAAHAQGLIHRDVKPANILLESGLDRAVLTDFGLARAADDASLTRSGVIAGTPHYMSPEQARGEPLDARSDIFSLGTVLYTLAAGRCPFRAETSFGILRRVTDDEPHSLCDLNPQMPSWLERGVGILLQKDPNQRLQSMQAVADMLEACLANVQHPGAALPEVLHESTPRERSVLVTRLRRRSKQFAWIAVVIGCAATVRWLAVWGTSPHDDFAGVSSLSPPPTSASNPLDSMNADLFGMSASMPGRSSESFLSTPWDDGISHELLDLNFVLDRLHSRTELDWDDALIALPPMEATR